MRATLISGRPGQPALRQKLIRQLDGCERFDFYVAFVTTGGIACIKQSLIEAEKLGKSGRILVSDYLTFTEPEALRQLLQFANVELRVLEAQKLHSKAYSFFRAQQVTSLVGSSNWTANAITSGTTELNVCVSDAENGVYGSELKEEFDYFFSRATRVTEAWLEIYRAQYELQPTRKPQPEVPNVAADVAAPYATQLAPNAMQREALDKLQALRDKGETKALVVSATGTGKTFLAAFDALAVNPKRLLFVVHRENIARKAMASFQRVFGHNVEMGVLSGNARPGNASFVFSTIQTVSKRQQLEAFRPDHFDYIIIDETHRAGGATYRRILDHFTPRFLLGMTATPERTDGYDIYQHFDHNIGYEIRLHRAMEEDMLCPFHYFGINDISVDGVAIEEESEFNLLVHEERVQHISEAINRYGSHDGRFRGLIFCSRIDECERLSAALNAKGFRTLALSGKNSEDERLNAMKGLESDRPDGLEFILTVDIFNEGVDIPSVNMILMLRPTQSSIVFIQQLGRGLRKTSNPLKYLTVIDFIGNYTNNFMIPMALYGDQSHDKDKLRRLVASDGSELPGSSTVQFDRISKDRIFQSINQHSERFNDLRKDWNDLRQKLGRIPWMTDFLEHDARHPSAFAGYSDSYRAFLTRMESERFPPMLKETHELLKSWTKHALNGTSLEEPVILQLAMERQSFSMDEVIQRIASLTQGQYAPRAARLEAAVRALNFRFDRVRVDSEMVPLGEALDVSWIALKGGVIQAHPNLLPGWGDAAMQLELAANDMARFALREALYGWDGNEVGLVRYRKYDRADVFRVLGTAVNPVAQNVGGYQIQNDRWCPIFVTYHKSEEISASTQYEDHFKSPGVIHWFSKSNRSMKSPDVQFFAKAARIGHKHLPLFVKKDDDEGISFYYLGDVRPVLDTFEEKRMKKDKGGTTPVVTMDLTLDQPVEDNLYHYLVGN